MCNFLFYSTVQFSVVIGVKTNCSSNSAVQCSEVVVVDSELLVLDSEVVVGSGVLLVVDIAV